MNECSLCFGVASSMLSSDSSDYDYVLELDAENMRPLSSSSSSLASPPPPPPPPADGTTYTRTGEGEREWDDDRRRRRTGGRRPDDEDDTNDENNSGNDSGNDNDDDATATDVIVTSDHQIVRMCHNREFCGSTTMSTSASSVEAQLHVEPGLSGPGVSTTTTPSSSASSVTSAAPWWGGDLRPRRPLEPTVSHTHMHAHKIIVCPFPRGAVPYDDDYDDNDDDMKSDKDDKGDKGDKGTRCCYGCRLYHHRCKRRRYRVFFVVLSTISWAATLALLISAELTYLDVVRRRQQETADVDAGAAGVASFSPISSMTTRMQRHVRHFFTAIYYRWRMSW